ncbi:hypothetical protein T484DRAFT_1749957 [Baffinella frigidus]|nr:hypothetical protein T484DRAFT_1749957 [Cryptophyta sp. CCMP2293]|mmetsp:Transcript_21958/g.52743  ORF Transcript_21958/g.52743 Transcript_21958/m.52743 type:complete len:149 (-) Transcript_21958:158-604(-)|eukprot:CAMPEP_0180129274 /NCGR_PEP_ID=MMETSP0986-20121125/7228_1 /TAXON_ID=697907 /ORGANISM="non described non described, Strain CCMP2293" /LENGTH=148 /DNA_ID=CAMNT_0022068931 /DNA_START=676 /DNA_END=1122 /DNA_ORIENTATION=+
MEHQEPSLSESSASTHLDAIPEQVRSVHSACSARSTTARPPRSSALRSSISSDQDGTLHWRHAAKSVTWDTFIDVREIPARTTLADAGICAEVLANALSKALAGQEDKVEGGGSSTRRKIVSKTVSWAAYVNIRAIPARSEKERQRQD